MGKLTARDVEAARHDPVKARPIRILDGDRLYLQVAPGGTKSWLFRYTRRGRAREMGLGRAGGTPGGVSLEAARALAAEARALLRQGRDPIDERKATRAPGPAKPPAAVAPLGTMGPRMAWTGASLAEARAALRRGLRPGVRLAEAGPRPQEGDRRTGAGPATAGAPPHRWAGLRQGGSLRDLLGAASGPRRGAAMAAMAGRRWKADGRPGAGGGVHADPTTPEASPCPAATGLEQERRSRGHAGGPPPPYERIPAPPPAAAAPPTGSEVRVADPARAASGDDRGEKSRKVLALVRRLPDRDIAQAKAVFTPEGRAIMAELEALRAPRPRGTGNRAGPLVERAAEVQEQEGLSDGRAAARVLAELPPAMDRANVKVGTEEWPKETVRRAVKRGLRQRRNAEAGKREAEQRDERDRARARAEMRAALLPRLRPGSHEAEEALREARLARSVAPPADASKWPMPTRHHIEAAREAAREIGIEASREKANKIFAARHRKPKR